MTKVDFEQMQVLKQIAEISNLDAIPAKSGLYFFFNKQYELLYIGSTTKSLQERIRTHVTGKGTTNTKRFYHEFEFVSWIEINAQKAALDTIKTLLVNGYFPKYNRQDVKQENQTAVQTIHSGCGKSASKSKTGATATHVNEKKLKVKQKPAGSNITYAKINNLNISETMKKLWSCREAATQLQLAENKIIAISEKLLSEQYFFQRDMKKNIVFTIKDLVLIQILLNMNNHQMIKKREIKEAISLVQKFGVKEALRLSERLSKS
ncbi:nuclease [Priestia megaterium]|nr:nuclease [Priestia megaterium]